MQFVTADAEAAFEKSLNAFLGRAETPAGETGAHAEPALDPSDRENPSREPCSITRGLRRRDPSTACRPRAGRCC